MLLILPLAVAANPHPLGTLEPAHFTTSVPTELDLLRHIEGGARIHVQATFPDGSRGLFLVDTGADISVLTRATAERLGLMITDDGHAIEGLGGVSRVSFAELPSLRFGTDAETTVAGIKVAIDVAGFSDHIAFMPRDGLLGNNVWSRFVLELDYPADLMVLHPPDSVKLKRKKSIEMHFDGHISSPIQIRTTANPQTLHQITLQVDTGAGELSICGRGFAFSGGWTTGQELVLGLGSDGPLRQSLQLTRRLALDEVRLGRQELLGISSARWMNFDGSGVCVNDMVGLAGHELLEQHRVFFDFGNQRMQLGKSRRKARQINGHRVLLDQTEDPWLRARLHIGLEEFEEALVALESVPPERAQKARLLRAGLHLQLGQIEAWHLGLLGLEIETLVSSNEIVALVNSLALQDKNLEALQVAQAGIEFAPEHVAPWVALSDLHLLGGEPRLAEDAIREAVLLDGGQGAFLLRRARVALALGDRNASVAHLRKQLQLYPSGGQAIGFYTSLADSTGFQEVFLADLEAAMAQVHPTDRPLDFLVAAHANAGHDAKAATLMQRGIERDCDEDSGASRDNCLAWYWSLAGVRPDQALELIERALEKDERADFLDTLATVRFARGEVELAHEAALAAVRRAPDNVYMLWQADRLGRLTSARGAE